MFVYKKYNEYFVYFLVFISNKITINLFNYRVNSNLFHTDAVYTMFSHVFKTVNTHYCSFKILILKIKSYKVKTALSFVVTPDCFMHFIIVVLLTEYDISEH